MRPRRGFTLWELSMVLVVMSIAATLAAPALARLGTEVPPGAADKLLALLHDTRKAAIDLNEMTTLRLDPQSMRYRVDTSGTAGAGVYVEGTLDMPATETLVGTQPRLLYVFKPTGAAFADTVMVRAQAGMVLVQVDPWSGVARAIPR